MNFFKMNSYERDFIGKGKRKSERKWFILKDSPRLGSIPYLWHTSTGIFQ